MENLTCELVQYHDKSYIKYTFQSNIPTVVTSAAYSKFDVTSDTFRQVTEQVGGFFANMTSRMIKKLNTEIQTLMLVCIPTKYIDPLFYFVYLDKYDNIIEQLKDDNIFDYDYFHTKLKDSMIEEGLTYDVATNKKFQSITDKISPTATLTTNLGINGRYAALDDVILYPSLDVIKEEMQSKLKALDAVGLELRFKSNILNALYLEAKIFDKNHEFIKQFQVESGIKDFETYLTKMTEKYGESYKDDIAQSIKLNPKTIQIPLSYAQKMTNLCSYKNNSK